MIFFFIKILWDFQNYRFLEQLRTVLFEISFKREINVKITTDWNKSHLLWVTSFSYGSEVYNSDKAIMCNINWGSKKFATIVTFSEIYFNLCQISRLKIPKVHVFFYLQLRLERGDCLQKEYETYIYLRIQFAISLHILSLKRF